MYSEYKSAQFANKGVPCLTKNLNATPRFEQTSKQTISFCLRYYFRISPLAILYKSTHTCQRSTVQWNKWNQFFSKLHVISFHFKETETKSLRRFITKKTLISIMIQKSLEKIIQRYYLLTFILIVIKIKIPVDFFSYLAMRDCFLTC